MDYTPDTKSQLRRHLLRIHTLFLQVCFHYLTATHRIGKEAS